MSKQISHTPGPWKCYVWDKTKPAHVEGDIKFAPQDTAQPVCDVTGSNRAELEANAQLIAAAPELLALLKEAYQYSNYMLPITVKQIEEAIAKAEGRS